MLWFLGVVGILYGMLMFFDFFFKSCMMLPYLEFLKSSGITVKFFRISIFTTGFNRLVNRWSSKLPGVYRKSFKVGSYVAMGLFPVAMIMMFVSLLTGAGEKNQNQNTENSEGIAHLEILVPGLNLPLSELGYYIIALLICSVIHEAGHGIAAVLEDVPVTGFGIQFLFIIPIAFTEIDTDHLQSAKLWKKLKIYSAGIWNNILLAGWAYTCLLLLPFFLTPIYTSDSGVFITKIQPKSPIRGENGLYIGDSITQINGCPVINDKDFIGCLAETIIHQPMYCVNEDFVHDNEESIHEIEHAKDGTVSCCPHSDPALNCFENLDEDRLPQFICLNIRKTVEHSKQYCHKSGCTEHSTSCIKPILSNTSTIIHMKRKNRVKDLVYYGHPADILRNIEISNYIPKTKVFEPWFADAITLLLKYVTVFSSGLAIVNVLPCIGLDGFLLVNAVIANLSSISKQKKELMCFTINGFGTSVLVLSVIKIIYTTFI